MSFWTVPRSASAGVALLLGDELVQEQEQRRGRVDRHRGRDLGERDPGEEELHVVERVDRDAGAPHLADGGRVVGVEPELRRQVERDREARLAALEQVAEARVRLLRRGEARVLPDRPRAAAVHVRVGPARERELARRLELAPLGVLRPVDRLDLDPRVGLAPILGRRHGPHRTLRSCTSRFDSSRACASGPARRRVRSSSPTAPSSPTSGPRWGSGTSRRASSSRSTAPTRAARPPLADGDEVALIPPVSGGAFRLSEQPLSVQAGDRRGRLARRRGDRDVRRHDAPALARPRRRPARVRGLRGHGRGGDGAHRRRAAREARPPRDRDPPPRRRRRDRRDERRDRDLGAAPRGRARACREAIDTLKQTVPLWKKEVYEGGEEWIGRGS